jgi:two-component system, NarL family, vancomycin resistance associated response regulator VraR
MSLEDGVFKIKLNLSNRHLGNDVAITDVATVRVLIVDNHELIRASLTVDLNRYANVDVVGAAADGEEAIRLTEELNPDVILMDLQMPVMDGLTASGHIKTDFPNIRIIAYTSLEDPQAEVMAQTAPIDRFCYKGVKTEELVELIHQVSQLS